jgi:hypothetical protein
MKGAVEYPILIVFKLKNMTKAHATTLDHCKPEAVSVGKIGIHHLN